MAEHDETAVAKNLDPDEARTAAAETDGPAPTADFRSSEHPAFDGRSGQGAAAADEVAWSRYAHDTGPEPRSYRLAREPAEPQRGDSGAIPHGYMARVIDGLYDAPETQRETDWEAGQ